MGCFWHRNRLFKAYAYDAFHIARTGKSASRATRRSTPPTCWPAAGDPGPWVRSRRRRKGRAVLPLCLGPAARGRGAVRRAPARDRARTRHRLTPLAQKLVWADRRIAARLSPTLHSLASELEANWARCACAAAAMPHDAHGRQPRLRGGRADRLPGQATPCRSSCATAPALTPWPRWRAASATWPASTCRSANSKTPRAPLPALARSEPHCLVHICASPAGLAGRRAAIRSASAAWPTWCGPRCAS
jgi:hypothetical protein